MARGHGKKSGKGRKAAAPSWRDVWKALVNPADGSCGLYSMLQLLLVKKRGMSASEAEHAIRRAAGTPEMRELLMMCRRRVVDYLRGCPDLALFFEDEGDAGSDVFTTGELGSLAEWEVAILKEGSYIDGIAILVLGRIFEIPDVRIVHEVRGVGLVDYFNPNDAVETTDQVPTIVSSGTGRSKHFEAMVPVAPGAGTKVSAVNDTGSIMDFFLRALNRPVDDLVDDGALMDAVISFVRRIPHRTASEKRAYKTHSTRKWTRTPLTRGRVSRFRDICRGLRSIRGGGDGDDSDVPVIAGATVAPVAPVAPVVPIDAGLPPASPEGVSTDSPGGENGGKPDEDTSEDRGAMDLSEAPEAAVAAGACDAPVIAEATVEAGAPEDAPVTVGTTRAPALSARPRSKRNAKAPEKNPVSLATRQERNPAFFEKMVDAWRGKIGVVREWTEERVAYEISCIQEEWDEAIRKHERKLEEERLRRELCERSCLVCRKNGDIANTLLCDKPIRDGRKCDNIYHVKCAGLKRKPIGDWFCPKCQEGVELVRGGGGKTSGCGGGGDGNDDDGAAVSDDDITGGDFGDGGSSDGDVDNGDGSAASTSGSAASTSSPTSSASSASSSTDSVSSSQASPDTSKQQEDLDDERDALPCLACGKNDDITNTLLCARPIGRKEDGRFCDKACHVRCTDSEDVPEGDWYCPECLKEGFVPPSGGIPPVSASSALSSTDSRDGGKVCGKGKSKSKRASSPSSNEGGTGEKKRKYKQRDGNGHKDIGDDFCKPWNDAVRVIMEKREKQALEQVEAYKDTVDVTTRKIDKLTYLGLMKTLVGGLTGDGEGQLEITPGKVFFKKDKLPSLQKFYDLNAKYNPTDVGVVLNETCVKIDGVVYTVESFEDGRYSLEDSDIEIGQWELLKKRCARDGGAPSACVTLEEDQKIYILSLIAAHEEMWETYIPYLDHGQTPQKYVDEVGTDGMLEDWSKRVLNSEEREELESVANMRRLSKLAFLDASVADIFHTLPVRAKQAGDAGHEEATFLRDFASKKGSLCDLNGLSRLHAPDVLRDRRDRSVMLKRSSDDDVHGSYHAHIDHAVELLQYVYRLNRVMSLHEAYLPLCTDELELLRGRFTCWLDNEDEQEHFFLDPYDINGSKGGMTVAMRFSLERSGNILPVAPPAMIRVLSRDQEEHGTLQDRSVHTGITTKTAKALALQKFIMDRDPEIDQHAVVSTATTAALGKVFGKVSKFLRKKRNQSGHEEGMHSGLHGPALRVRKGKAPFAGFSNEESLEMLELLFEGLYRNGMKKVLDAIKDIDKTCAGKGGWCYDILKAVQVAAQNTAKKAKFKEEHLQGDEDQKARIADVVRELKARGISRKDFMNASVAAALRDMCSSASLRNQGFFFRPATRLCVEHRRESRNLGRMVAGLPKKSKVLKHGNGSGNGVAREHVIDVDCGDWYAITTIIGRPFFRSFDDYDGKQSPYIGPVDERGHAMSQKRFNRIVKKIGRSYLGVSCLTFNQLRSACTSLVMTECTKLGKRMDDPVVMDFASTILSSVKMMRKQYDIHRAAKPLDRGIHEKYKGAVDFCGGAYGILKGAVERERKMAGSGKASSAGVGVKEGTDVELPMQLQLQLELKARKLELEKIELDLMERRQQLAGGSAAGVASQPVERDHALKAPIGGALQSQCIGEDRFEVNGEAQLRRCERPTVNKTCFCADHQQQAAGGSSTGETGDHDAGVGQKRVAEQDSNPVENKRITRKKVREIKDGEREGMLVVLGAIKAAHARAREKASGLGDEAEKYAKILRRMNKPRCRDDSGHYGMVKYLQEHDAKFSPGEWYMGSQFGTATENKQKSFVALKDQLIQNDAESGVANKFVWVWHTCSKHEKLGCTKCKDLAS